MTYISRKSRIFVSRYLDGRESENALRLCRKRSEGRLKRFTSCDDVRAWINNNCIKYEHFLDLMSDGESKKNVCGRLYGRFIPVPFLIKLFQQQIGDSSNSKNEAKMMKSHEKDKNQENQDNQEFQENQETLLRKELQKYAYLLNVAIGKLEKIDRIVLCANADFENARQEEIQEMFKSSRDICFCSNKSNNSLQPVSAARSSARKFRGSAQGSAILRKISGLHEELKKIQEISEQLESCQCTPCEPTSYPQVTELYNRKNHNTKRSHKKLEKLLAKKGRILTEICDDLRNLNNIKKASRSSILCFRKKKGNKEYRSNLEDTCTCECVDSYNYSGNVDVCDSKYGYTVTSSTDISLLDECLKTSKAKVRTSNEFMFDSSELLNACNADEFRMNNLDTSYCMEDQDNCLGGISNYSELNQTHVENESKYFQKPEMENEVSYQAQKSKARPQKANRQTKNNVTNTYSDNKKYINTKKSEKVKKKEGVCMENTKTSKNSYPESGSKKRNYIDNLKVFQMSYTVKSKKPDDKGTASRPQTAPKIKREEPSENLKENKLSEKLVKSETSLLSDGIDLTPDLNKKKEKRMQKRSKSEITMKEIEKTLRNYEKRLCCVDTLDYKVEEMRQKLWESCKYKKQVASERAKSKKLQAVERQKSNKKMMSLCSENTELKKQLEELTAKYESQCEKIQNLKYNANRALELECETQMLKKEISDYQESLDYQRKCLTDWENIVAVQRTEIENLENQVKNLRMCMDQQSVKCNAQRSRSYSPEAIRLRAACGQKPQGRRAKIAAEEDVICCYDGCRINELEMNQDSGCERWCCSPTQNVYRCYN